MNGLPDWNQEPSGLTPEQPAKQKRSAGLLLSGILIGISLLAFVLPLAAYHVAQVASILRVRSGLFLISVVSLFLYVLGIATRLPVFVMAGTTGFCAIPFLAASLMLRVKSRSPWWALVVLAVPVFFAVGSLLSVPRGFNIENWLNAELANLPQSTSSAQRDLVFNQLKSSPVLAEMQKLFNLEAWQRLAWFLFADGGALSVSIFGSLVGTLVLIDFAFNQTERMRGVISYVLERKEGFPKQMVAVLEQTYQGMRALLGWEKNLNHGWPITSVEVQSHEKKAPRKDAESSGVIGFLKRFRRAPYPPGTSDVFGYRFNLSIEPGWHLRAFAMPLWLSIPSLGLLMYLALRWRGDAALATWLPDSPMGPLLMWGAVAAVGVMVGLALQGALVLHSCLRPLAALAVVFAVLLLSSSLQGGPLLLVAVLAGLGLLDNAYDFRNRLAKSKNAV